QPHVGSIGRADELGRDIELLSMRRSECRERRQIRIDLDRVELSTVPLELRRMLTQPAITFRGIGERGGKLPSHLRGGGADWNAHATLTLQLVGHGRRPRTRPNSPDVEGVGNRVIPKEGMGLLIQRALQLPEPRLDEFELLDGADALIANRGMRRPPADAKAERERAGLCGDQTQPGRPAPMAGTPRAA